MTAQLFDLLNIETEVVDRKIKATATGSLAEAISPFLTHFINVLNSLKVIHEHPDGTLQYNLYNPPQPTKAGMRALEKKLKELVVKHVLPGTANLAITHACQCKCIHCSAEPFIDGNRDEITVEKIKEVVDGAMDLMCTLVIFVGGEPLLSPAIFELIDYVPKDKAMPMIFTNGALLEKYAERLATAGLRTLNISIDSDDPATHNEWRKVPDLYRKAFDGAVAAREHGILTGISTYASHETLANGQVERLINHAAEQGFHEITIFDCMPSGKFLKKTDMVLTPAEKKEVIALTRKYHNNPDFKPGVIAQSIVNSPMGAGCFGAYSQFYMTAYGDINPCDFNPISFGNVNELPIQAIWQKMVSTEGFDKKHMTCRMQAPAYRAKFIDPLPEGVHLPVPIEEYAPGGKYHPDTPHEQTCKDATPTNAPSLGCPACPSGGCAPSE